jgi:hypothetical protein
MHEESSKVSADAQQTFLNVSIISRTIQRILRHMAQEQDDECQKTCMCESMRQREIKKVLGNGDKISAIEWYGSKTSGHRTSPARIRFPQSTDGLLA